jgi:hypothetical protein
MSRTASPTVQAIRQAAGTLFEPGQVVEVRVPNYPRGKSTTSGYFDDFDALARAAASCKGKASVYVTLNPVNPALLARACNRMREYAPATTGDADILRRAWLLLDFDAVRPSGISSTEAEHDAALARAVTCRDFLTGLGWPMPVEADSGNGGHLLYRIDLANNAGALGLVGGCLEALDLLFSDKLVTVDTSVDSAGQLSKLYGTVAMKGDNTRDRPHRTARLLSVPDKIGVVPVDLLEALAARKPAQEPKAKHKANGKAANGFDVDGFLAKHNLEVANEGPWEGGYKWVLAVCPWNEEHTNRSAFVLRHPSGAVSAGCHHNSCRGKRWEDLREKFEPGCYDRKHEDAAPGAGHGDKKPDPPKWEELIPLGEPPDVLPFPVDTLPPSARQAVNETAAALPCPPDYVAVPLLAVAGAAIGRSRELAIKHGHTQPALLYAAVVGLPGRMKSPALKVAVTEAFDLERTHHERFLAKKKEYDEEMETYKAAVDDYKAELRDYRKEMKKKKKPDEGKKPEVNKPDPPKPPDLSKPADPPKPDPPKPDPPKPADLPKPKLTAEKPKRPVHERAVVIDATAESLVPILSENPRGVIKIQDELTAWVLSMNQYRAGGKGADRQFWLSNWACMSVVVDRKQTHEQGPLLAKDPFVAVTGGLPPDRLRTLRNEKTGRPDDDGFFDRLLFSYAKELPASPENGLFVDPATLSQLHRLLGTLRGMPMVQEETDRRPFVVRLTAEGREAWRQFTVAHAAETNAEDFPTHLEGPWSKLKGYCARLALILHFLWIHDGAAEGGSESDVGADAVRRAAKLVAYFKSHARKVYAVIDVDDRIRDARRLARWLQREFWGIGVHSGRNVFSKRDMHAGVWGGNHPIEVTERVLDLLCKHNYLRPLEDTHRPGPGRQPSPRFEVNPALFSTEVPEECTPIPQNSQNREPGEEG